MIFIKEGCCYFATDIIGADSFSEKETCRIYKLIFKK
jgi:hypothetical protein